MRVEIRHPSHRERDTEDLTDWTRIRPVIARQTNSLKLSACAVHDCRRWKKRIVIRPQLFFAQKLDPVFNNTASIVADRKKPSRKRLGEFGPHLARVLDDIPFR